MMTMMPITSSTPALLRASVDSGVGAATAAQKGPFRNLQSGIEGCVQSQSLQTPFEADTVVFGTMYTVLSHADPISMLTMEISANPVATTMDVKIYTKLGDYKGAEADSEQWTQIVDTTLTPSREGRGTIIPTSDFDSFIMNPNELRAFFVSLKSSDLRYKRAEGLGEGQPFVSDGYLSVNVGIGVAEPDFGNQIFPERMFSGIFHYTHATNCDTPSSKSLVMYSFHARPQGGAASREDIIAELDKRVRDAVEEIISTDMVELRDEHDIRFESISTVTSNLEEEYCPVGSWTACVLLDSKVILSHRNTITSGQLQYLLLNHGNDVATQAQQGTIQAKYAGYDTLKKAVNIALQGVPYGVPMNNEQKLFVEQTTTEYLAENTVGLTNARIIGTNITGQRGPDFVQRRLRKLEADSTEEGWIELSVDVLALSVPPVLASDDLFGIINEAFRGGGEEFVEDLKFARLRPGSPVTGEGANYFVGIKRVSVKDGNPNSGGGSNPNASSMDGPSTDKILGVPQSVFITVCAIGLLGTVTWIWYAFCRNKSNGAAPEVAYVDSTGQRRRRSSVFFGSGGKQSASVKKGTKVGQVAAKKDKEDSAQSREVLSSSSTGRSKSRERGDGCRAKTASREIGAPSSVTKSITATRNGDMEAREVESLYKSVKSSSKSPHPISERSSSKKTSNDRSSDRNKAQTERVIRPPTRSSSKSPKRSYESDLRKDETAISHDSRGIKDSSKDYSKRSTKSTTLRPSSSGGTRQPTRSTSTPMRSASPRMLVSSKDERTARILSACAKSERFTTEGSIRAKRSKAQSASLTKAADVPTPTSRSSKHSRAKPTASATTTTTIIAEDDKSIGLD